MVLSRDEALRSNDAMRNKLTEFEEVLRDVSVETRSVLDDKEAVLRRFEAERETEREEHSKGVSRYVWMSVASRVVGRGEGGKTGVRLLFP